MKMHASRRAAVIALMLGLGGCANGQIGYKEPAGALLGGVGGAVAGAQFGSGSGRLASTAAGALLGAAVGQQAGRSLDRADFLYGTQGIPQQVPRAYSVPPPVLGTPYSSYGRYRHGAGYAYPSADVPSFDEAGCQPLPVASPWAPQQYACPGPSGWTIR